MNTDKDYYAILGVLPTAEDAVIKAAYKALAMIYHPDLFKGSREEANQRMAILNEAYAVLSNPEKRKGYDKAYQYNQGSSDSYFEEDNEFKSKNDPLAESWKTAIRYFPDLPKIEARLSKISWRLAYTYKARLLETKQFDQRQKIAYTMEIDFLKLYFGNNPEIIEFASMLIMNGNKAAAKELNQAVSILGKSLPNNIIQTIAKKYNILTPEEKRGKQKKEADLNIKSASNEVIGYEVNNKTPGIIFLTIFFTIVIIAITIAIISNSS